MKAVQVLWVFVLSVCLGGVAVQAEESATKAATAAAEGWLGQVDTGKYAESWQGASTLFRGAVTEPKWVESLHGVRTPLGELVSRQLKSAQLSTSLPGAPDGHYVVMQFATRFEHKQAAVETVTCMQEKDGRWKAAGYYIK